MSDTILLANLSTVCLLMSSKYFKTQAIKTFFLSLLPVVLITLLIVTKTAHSKIFKNESFKQKLAILFRGFSKIRNTIIVNNSLQSPSSSTSSLHDNDHEPLLRYTH